MELIELKELETAYLRPRQVAEICNVSLRTVWTWIGEGSLKTVKFGDKSTRVSARDFRDFVEERTGIPDK